MNRIFTRIMAVVLGAILALTAALSLIHYFSLRSQRMEARLEELAGDAEDIAYLAADYLTGSFTELFFDQDPGRYLEWKAQQVYGEYGAYIAVVDRWGNRMDNLRMAYGDDPDFVASLSGEEISEALGRVLAGESIRVRNSTGGAPAFTVGVPFRSYGTVIGAVLIQTKAQVIQSGMEDLLIPVVGAALAVMLLSGAAVGLYVRSLLKPLGALTAAAGAMAGGDFGTQVDETRGETEIRQLSKAFNTMSGRLREVENSRREFVANVSHELRSPITSIRGFAEGMADGVIPPEEQPKYLRLVAEESRRLSALVEDLLALSRLEREDARLEVSVFDMNEMLRRAVIRRVTDLDAKELETECVFETDPCPVRGDRDRIEQVAVNLLDNAVKFTPAGGRILLGTGTAGKEAEITVWDSGPEIPPEDRERIFERFFTADRAHTAGKGTGLGLSICQRIMAMHGREITLMSAEEGRAAGGGEQAGTGFRFRLERATEEELREKERERKDGEHAGETSVSDRDAGERKEQPGPAGGEGDGAELRGHGRADCAVGRDDDTGDVPAVRRGRVPAGGNPGAELAERTAADAGGDRGRYADEGGEPADHAVRGDDPAD